MDNTFNTLEEIQATFGTSLFGDDQITLRSEQRDAIDRAKAQFCKRSGSKASGYQWTVQPKYSQYLWNAKMRFGKTLCALQLAREMDVKRTLIVTHRPVVNKSWKDDFDNVVTDRISGNDNQKIKWDFGTLFDDEQHDKRKFYDLEKFANQSEDNHYVFFVSMQYLRLSELVNAKTQLKNKDKQDDMFGHNATKENEKLKADILNADWDLVVIDEAHEGTRTALGKRVIDEFLKKDKTKMLHLSGTPFNLYEDFKEEEIFTWDYVSEQQAKLEWNVLHPNEPNPYAELPKMNIFTYDITNNIKDVVDHDGVFTFNEFLRTWTGNPKADKAQMPQGAKGRFVHEEEVKKFLQLLCTKDDTNNFPFSTTEYRQQFRHTLWVVSHVDEATALTQLLREHPVFKRFDIVNVAGKGDIDEQNENALDAVNNAIGELPEKTSTITISCGRLTTGVTVRPWSAVLYLKGGDGAATYMQTIFRVQSPYKTPDGKMKTSCYVFDFAPDRTLKIVAETAKFSSMAKAKEKKEEEGEEEKTQELRDKETVNDFIALCPVISMDGGKMSPLDVNTIYKQLENVFIDRLVRKGFDDPCLYNQDELNKIDKDIVNHIGENGGKAPDEKRQEAKKAVDLSHMTEEERAEYEESIRRKKAEAAERAKKKAQKDEKFKKQWEEWTDEQREEWLQKEAERLARNEELKKAREEFKARMTNIRGIALRIPLLMYGGADAGDPKEYLTVDNFTRKIKDESWAEFMPKGISKEDFNKIRKCFNATRFEEAGKKYRALTREADFMHVDERIKQIAEIFSYFRNPDKETVLTPWRVVNMHMSDTIGGYCFYDETFDEKTGYIDKPRYEDRGDVTDELFNTVDDNSEVPTKILEINSKTGLYPLYVTYSLYRRRLQEYIKAKCVDIETISVQEEQVVWDDIVTDNMFVICNTPMAVGITRRTLFGFRQVEKKANIKSEQLIERARNDMEALLNEIKSVGFWKGNTSKQEMEFNAIIGNPPYQVTDKGECTSSTAIYPLFIELARSLKPNYVSMITPSRWMTKQGRGLSEEWADKMLTSNHFKYIRDYLDANDCFPGVEIKGGVCYFLYQEAYTGNCNYVIQQNGKISVKDCSLNSWGMVIRDQNADSILRKVSDIEGDSYYVTKSFASIVQARHHFDQGTQLSTSWRGYVENEDDKHNIKCFLNKQLISCGYGWVMKSDIPKNHNAIPMIKIYISKAYGAGEGFPHQILGVPFLGEKNSVCTDTYLVIRPENGFSSEEECNNAISYMKTRFFRYLVSVKKKTQDAARDVYQFVPLQDFSKPWSDEELYNKYGLDLFEREYIESMIKPME